MKHPLIFSTLACFFGTLLPALASSDASSADGDMTHKMTRLAIQIGIILFAARFGGLLAEKMKLPGVLGELASGILIGPYALGAIPLGSFFSEGVFPVIGASTFPVTPELYGFCTIASIILLFLSGVETDMKMFVRYSLAGTLVGVGGVVGSFILGDLCAVLLMPRILGSGPIGFMSPPALFLGIMGTATSVGITARILSERKCIDSEEGVTTMAGAVIDDVLGIIVLAVGLGIIGSQNAGNAGIDWGHIGKIAAKAFGIWLGATAIGMLAARKISGLLKLNKNPLPIAIMSFGLALMLAGFFESMGLAMIIGAYVMGLALSRTDIRYLIQENLTPIYAFMVPMFFCVMGMMVDLKQILSTPVLTFGAVYTVLAIIAKIASCSLPALFCGFNLLGSIRIGAGMVPRGEVALIVAGIGLSSGFLSPEIFGIGILMTLVTTLIAPPMLVSLYSNQKSGLKHPKSDADTSRPISFVMPSVQSAEMMCEKMIEAFRSEGFFTHTLSREDAIWQIRRDEAEIGMQRLGNTIHFECSPREQSFIATAILEVSADLTHLANELSKPIKTASVAHQVGASDGESHAHAEADVARYIRQFIFMPHLVVNSREALLKELVTRLFEKGLITNEAEVLNALNARETIMSTGLECGIAIPHARTDATQSLVGIIAVVHAGVPDYPTLDGSLVNIVALTLSPRNSNTPHLRVISHLGKTLDAQGREALLAARTEQAMLNVLLG